MKARIRFYDIQKCGYYFNGQHQFGSTMEMLTDLQRWISDKTLKGTLTYEVSRDVETPVLETYCHSIVRSENEFLMVTWNELPSSEGQTCAIQTRVPITRAKIDIHEVPDGYTPGYPTYFWFLPEKNQFATIQFGTLLNGRANLNAYLNGFLARHSHRCRADENEDVLNIVYLDDSGNEGNFTPNFVNSIVKKPGPIEEIIQRREQIRKIVKKDTYAHERELNRFFSVFGINIREEDLIIAKKKTYQIALDFKPTERQLMTMIRKWEESLQALPFADIGFEFQGGKERVWLRKAVPTREIDLAVEYQIDTNNILFNPLGLLHALQEKRSMIFNF